MNASLRTARWSLQTLQLPSNGTKASHPHFYGSPAPASSLHPQRPHENQLGKLTQATQLYFLHQAGFCASAGHRHTPTLRRALLGRLSAPPPSHEARPLPLRPGPGPLPASRPPQDTDAAPTRPLSPQPSRPAQHAARLAARGLPPPPGAYR